MNQHRNVIPDGTAAKRRFTVDEFEAMGMAGIFGPGERLELIAGEIIRMSPAGRFHEVLRSELNDSWNGRPGRERYKILTEMPLEVAGDFEPVADILIYPRSKLSPDVRGPDVYLLVEIAESSWKMDTTIKASAYAAGGVREYWVVNARTRVTLVHREPGAEGYAVTFEVAPDQVATPLLVPELAIRLSDLPGAE